MLPHQGKGGDGGHYQECLQKVGLAVVEPSANELAAVQHSEVQRAQERRHEVERRFILGRKDTELDREMTVEALTKLSWEKADTPLSANARDEMRHGMIQVTPVLALRRRNREGSGDTWRYRSTTSRKDHGGLGRSEGSPDPRRDSTQTGGRCCAGEGLEFGRRGDRWSVGKPRVAGRGRTVGCRDGEKDDSWAVGGGGGGSGLWRRHHTLPRRSPCPRAGAQGCCPALVGRTCAGMERRVASPPD